MRRVYTNTAHFRAPLSPVMFAGLGSAPAWPAGRTYYDTSNFLRPYDEGYYQDNSLFGFGADPLPPGVSLPSAPPPRVTPTWVVVAGGVAAVGAMALVAYYWATATEAHAR